MPPDDGRIHALEDQVGDLRRQIAGLLQRESDQRKPHYTRIALTAPFSSSGSGSDSGSGSGEYPGAILEIVALDCSSPGDEASSGSDSGSDSGSSDIETDAYPIVFADCDSDDVPGRQSVAALPRQVAAETSVAHALHPMTSIPEGDLIEVFWLNQRWWVDHPGNLVGVQLAENHPGRGVAFSVNVGVWDPTAHKWDYTGGTAQAIDWRYGVTYPAIYSTGLAEWRPG